MKHMRKIVSHAHHKTKTFGQKILAFIRHHATILSWLGLALGFILLGAFFLWISLMRIPTLQSFDERKVINSTKILDRTEEVVLYDVHNTVKRTMVLGDQIPEVMKQATIAIEDKEFYSHNGIRISSIFRAVLANLTSQGYSQGGSTITQQVVKNTLLTGEKRVSRKIKEWILAVKLERVKSKDEILTLYLNEVPYGGALYGVEQASKTFFGKSVGDITLAEASYLAAIPNAPTYFSPYGNNRDKLEVRKNLVLKNMLDQGFISQAEYDEAKQTIVTWKPLSDTHAKSLHFVEYIKQYVEEKYGNEALNTGGLKVVTTLDWELQKEAERIVAEQAAKNETEWAASNQALVAIDPKTGQIISMVGSRNYSDTDIDGAFNVALAHRQPGSSFKPIIYARAFEKGFTPDTVLFDVRTQFNPSCDAFNFSSTLPCYAPEDYDAKYPGPISLRNALGQSRNVPAVQLLYLVGINDALRTAKNLGITTLDRNADRYGLTLVLGGGEVSLLEMTSAYGTFANDGTHLQPTGILRIEASDGTILEDYTPRAEQIITPQASRLLSSVLSDNVARTPLFGANSFFHFPGRDVAGKTGTTNDNKDAWVFGYTPNLVVGVWTGNNDNTPMKKGSSISGPAWRAYMDIALAKLPNESFTEPDPISPDLKPVLRGFWYGNESFFVDTVSGKRATELTPPETKKEYVIPSAHNILHWIDTANPAGPAPENPSSDAQYDNWEAVVRAWINQHPGVVPNVPPIPNQDDDVHTIAAQPRVTLDIGNVDGYTDTTFELDTTIQSQSGMRSVDYYANTIYLGSDTSAPFSFSFTPSEFNIGSGTITLRAIATDIYYNRGEGEKEITIN
ncbi:MAG: PBP1A family penicillin-binding protein [Candidatus Pacebacteria bacterium]|nr:PBP1A family penicillin-binding protein [Candidatus Paceibacterota bacterium]